MKNTKRQKGAIPKIKVDKKEKKKPSRFKEAWLKLAYTYEGGFSLTRIMMFACFASAAILLLVGVVCGIFGKVLPDNIYDYAFKMSLGGATQYAITKGVDVIKEVKGTKGE